MTTSLVAAGTVRLFGCAVDGIEIKQPDALAKLGLSTPRLAWIYGFAFEGHYYDLARPTIAVVDGDGEAVSSEVAVSGLPATPPNGFSGGIMVWAVDRDDMSVRLDVTTGPFERTLLEPEMKGDRLSGAYSGANLRLGGANRPLTGS